MPQREREHDPRPQEQHRDTQPGSPPPDSLGPQRAAGEALYAAGDAAIRQALSGNSQQFNTLVEQEGGQ